MIIVEGPDGAGKTTLVREITKEFGLRVGERAQSDRKLLYKSTRQDTYTALAKAVDGVTPPLVWDRLFFSEFVYCDLVGRPCEFSDMEQYFIYRCMEAVRAVRILCLPPLSTVLKNAAEDEQMDGVMENLQAIYRGYEAMAHNFDHHYDYTIHSLAGSERGAIDSAIRQYIEDWKERSW